MKEGKMSNDLLQDAILNQLSHKRDDILIGPGIGEDCAAIEFGDLACVLSTDPITGATKDIGKIAVHISCNDIASSGLMPIAILITLLMPLEASQEDARAIMKQAHETASEMNVAIIGGHTEFTSAVIRSVVSVTAIGKGAKKLLAATSGAKAGDVLVMSKWAGLEGTAIIANEKADVLLAAGMSAPQIDRAVSMLDYLSVVPEGIIGAKHSVHAMHDVTEGGIYGAIWEMCKASGLGAEIELNAIPILAETKMLCEIFELNPYKLISSGSMLMAMTKSDFLNCQEEAKAKGILLSTIGTVSEKGCIKVINGTDCSDMEAPEVDELYKVFQ
jgi:hydrogenase expression/formation protein HypE